MKIDFALKNIISACLFINAMPGMSLLSIRKYPYFIFMSNKAKIYKQRQMYYNITSDKSGSANKTAAKVIVIMLHS